MRLHRFLRSGFLVLAAQAFLLTSAAAQPSPQWIRVAVSQDDSQVDLQVHGHFTILAMHTGKTLQEGKRLHPTPVRAVPEGLAVGQTILPIFGVRIEAARDATISLNGRRLRGTLEIVRQKDLTLLVINHVGLEDYLQGVLSKEAPDYWPEEALKAIAIAARTYAVYQRLTKEAQDYDVTGNVMSQDYGGHAAEKDATTRAVQATRNLVLTTQGKLFPAFYHSTCGGRTEHGRVMGNFDLEPLQGGVVCHFCSASPFYAWQRRLTRADVAWALRNSRHGAVGSVQALRTGKLTPWGRVEQVVVVGSQRTLTLSGYDFRALFGFERIRSLFFTILESGEDFILSGHGWGHGVGMCQWRAAELARRGLSAREILAVYYPGASLASLQDLEGQPIGIIGGGS